VQTVSIIDGSKDPSAIPDIVAYRHFFGVLRRTSETEAADEARRQSYLSFYFRGNREAQDDDDRALDDTQVGGLLTVVDHLQTVLKPIDAEIKAQAGVAAQAPGALPSPELVALRQRRDDAVISAVQAINIDLGADAASKVRRHVLDHVKPHIRITEVQIPLR
jgi:hypothetical protein